MASSDMGNWRRTRYVAEITAKEDGHEVIVAGWTQDTRVLGGIAFIILRDKTGTIQLTLKKKALGNKFKDLISLPRESVIMAKGIVNLNPSVAAGIEIIIKDAKILNIAKTPLPLGIVDKVGADLDTRLNARFLDLRKPEVMAIFRLRAVMLSSIRKTLESLGFIEVHTPKIVMAATEGGTALFPVRYFDKEAYLNQSPQLYKQILMATGMDRVYEIAPAFRAEAHDTTKHLNEFTSIDVEMAFSDHNDAMSVLEDVIINVIADIGKCEEELGLLHVTLPEATKNFPKITYDDCVDMLKAHGHSIRWGEDLDAEAMKIIAKEYANFYFIVDWPAKIKPFYAQPWPSRPETCKAFDLNFGEKEITSGAQRVHNADLLRARLRKKGLNLADFEFYIKAFEYGMPPHAGWGLGTERLLMILTGATNIRECVLFPRDRKRVVP